MITTAEVLLSQAYVTKAQFDYPIYTLIVLLPNT